MARPRKPRWPPLPRRAPGTGSLQRLSDGRLRARLPARIDPKRTAREFPPDALDEATAWLDSHLTGSPALTATITLDEWSGRWWLAYVKPIRSPTTASLYLIALKDLAPIGSMLLEQLRPSDFQRVVAALSERLAPSTLAVRISIWRSCLERAVDDELLARNPVRNLDVAKPIKRQDRRGWTVKEVRALWMKIRGQRFEAAYALVIGCGLRIGEVLGLAWEHVDIERRRIWIGPQFTGGLWRDHPKGRNPHWIDVPEPVVLVLIRHRDAQPPGCRLVFQSPHPRTVRTATGRARLAANAAAGRPEAPWSYTTVRADFLALAEQLKLGDRRQHAGRHGLASALLEDGIPPAVVAAVLGHADSATTLSIYSHPSQEGHERALAAVDRLLGIDLDTTVPGSGLEPETT